MGHDSPGRLPGTASFNNDHRFAGCDFLSQSQETSAVVQTFDIRGNQSGIIIIGQVFQVVLHMKVSFIAGADIFT